MKYITIPFFFFIITVQKVLGLELITVKKPNEIRYRSSSILLLNNFNDAILISTLSEQKILLTQNDNYYFVYLLKCHKHLSISYMRKYKKNKILKKYPINEDLVFNQSGFLINNTYYNTNIYNLSVEFLDINTLENNSIIFEDLFPITIQKYKNGVQCILYEKMFHNCNNQQHNHSYTIYNISLYNINYQTKHLALPHYMKPIYVFSDSIIYLDKNNNLLQYNLKTLRDTKIISSIESVIIWDN